jgi:very-short-patch-repair endonuclease
VDNEKLQYKVQHKFTTCRHIGPLRFDFYLPELGILLEFQGKQHFVAVKYFGGAQAFKSTQRRDRIKRNWARKNGYELIAIRFDEDVEKVLTARFGVSLQKAA